MKRGTKILHNRIMCKKCGEILESKHVHDWVCCKCWKESNGEEGCFCDGGHDYLRIGGDPNMWINLCESRLFTDEEVDEYNRKQIAISGEYGWAVDLMEKD